MAKRNVEVEFSLIDGVSKGLAKIDKSLGGVASSLGSVSVAAAATAAAVGAIAIGAGLADGVKDAAAFEVSLDRISARTGVTGAALNTLGESILKISENATKTGEQGAAAFQRLAEEGLTADQALKALPTTLNFATTASQGAAEAVGGLADTLDQFGLSADNIPRAADVITSAALTAGTGVTQLQAALTAAGPTARDLGLTLEQTAAAIAVLAQNGIEGGKAGKTLATAFDQLRDPSSKLRKELQAIGITSKDFNVVLAQLAKAGPKAAGAFNALGLQGTAALKALSADGGKALADITKQLGDVEGATDKAAKTINTNFTGALNALMIAFDRAQVQFLTPLLDPLAKELDALRVQIGAFIASPEFAKLSTDFRDAFLQALEAAKKFVAEFDLKSTLKQIEDFTSKADTDLREFKETVDEIASGVKAAVAGIQAFFNGIQTGVAAAVAVTARSFETLNSALGVFSERYRENAKTLGNIADIASAETATQFAQLTANIETLGGELSKTADATDEANKAQAEAAKTALAMGPAYDEAAQNAARLANNQKVLADASQKAAEEQAAAAKTAGYSADAYKISAEAIAEAALVHDAAVESFKKEQVRIQANIDANKALANSYSQVGDSVDEAAVAVDAFNTAVAEDAGYSSAVFAALGARLDAIAPKIAELAGVSEKSIRDGVLKDTMAATNGFTGMNSSMERLEQRFVALGGDNALKKIRDDAAAAAEKIATMGERARTARDELRDLGAALQDAQDERGGNQEAIEERRYQEQLARINELAARSGSLNNAEAQRIRALALAEHEARLREIRDEQLARVRETEAADNAIDGRRAGNQLQTRSEAAAAGTGTPITGGAPINITINALDLRDAPGLIDRLDTELKKKQKASL